MNTGGEALLGCLQGEKLGSFYRFHGCCVPRAAGYELRRGVRARYKWSRIKSARAAVDRFCTLQLLELMAHNVQRDFDTKVLLEEV